MSHKHRINETNKIKSDIFDIDLVVSILPILLDCVEIIMMWRGSFLSDHS